MSVIFSVRSARLVGACAALAVLAACDEPLDYDLRGNLGGFSTAPAAQSATAARPEPDARGVITYPNYQVAVAQPGDTVNSLAARVGLPAGEVARFNGLNADNRLRDGEVIALPRKVAVSGPASGSVDIATLAGDAIDASPDTTPVQTTTLEPAQQSAPPVGKEPVRHKVKRGETAYTISRLYQVPVKSLAEWNGLGPDFAVRE
ncbi:MAG: LysM peptidoglycan-binding domain-containing protein, partial [Pseudomonadota bacterium]